MMADHYSMKKVKGTLYSIDAVRKLTVSYLLTFYGSAFVAGPTGKMVTMAEREEEIIITAEFDLEKIRALRTSWGIFRDRYPSQYRFLMTSNRHSGV